MRVLVDVVHPAQVHFFVPLVRRLLAENHQVLMTARDKDVELGLLRALELPHRCISSARPGPSGRFLELISRNWRLAREVDAFGPDIILAKEGASACQVGWWKGVPVLAIDDTDDAWLQRWLSLPFATQLLTDERYPHRRRRNHETFRGISPLAYLVPARVAGVEEGERGRIGMRLVRWEASHDWGKKGLSEAQLGEWLDPLTRKCRVAVSSERCLPPLWRHLGFGGEASQWHSWLSQCHGVVSESPTVVAEAVVLGVPSVYVSPRRLWYTEHLEELGLIESSPVPEVGVAWLLRHVRRGADRTGWEQRRDAYLAETEDVTGRVWSAAFKLAGSARKKEIFKL